VNELSSQWFDPLFRAEAMRRVFSDRGRLQGILDFEAALAKAQARAGIIPETAAEVIARHCRAELFDIRELSRATALAGNSAIPIIGELTRLVASESPAAGSHVHYGATSQDAMDTGLVLQIRQGLNLMETEIKQLCTTLARIAAEHKETAIAGRTWLQHGAPTTFGLKAAGWLCAVARDVKRLRALRPRALAVQFGGAVGTLAALGNRAEKTASLLAEELGLGPAELPWHSQRDRLVEVSATLGLLVGSLGKMARDISLMCQSEIAEVAEPAAPGRGGSSSMPQKRNPVGCATVLATATRVPALVSVMLSAMTQEHERGLGGWQAEWETLPEVFLLASGALSQMRQIIEGLRIDASRMSANLEVTHGLIYAEAVSTALAQTLGRPAAHKLVERVCRQALEQNRHLLEVASEDAEITANFSAAGLQLLFDPRQHVRAAARLVDQALAAVRASVSPPAQEAVTCPSRK
jgi:3-carboxy-cis,cis-muconate cycloisomerase